jgi:hypothetical protein
MSDIRELDNIWNGEEAETAKRLEPGTYRGEVVDFKISQIGKNYTWALIAMIRVTMPAENEGAQVEKIWWLTPKAMPYVSRDLKDIECPLFKDSPLSEQLQNLPLAGKQIDFRYDIPKGGEYPEVQWLRLSKNSANVPQGAGHGVKLRAASQAGTGAQEQEQERKNTIPF